MAPGKNLSEVEAESTISSGFELCIMRHGAAVEAGTAGSSDDTKRPLTPKGRKRMLQIAKGLARAGFEPEWIVSSPLVRAAETAEIVAKSLLASGPPDFCEALRPGGSAEALIAFLAKQPERRKILIVGHEPDLSELAARLMGANRHANLAFKKGGCCLVTFNEFPPKSPGQLVWWLTPRILRKLA